jgi:hypothetical protein
MAQKRRAITVGAATAAALALVVPPASAATTYIHRDTATGPLYSGTVQAQLIGSATVSTTLGDGVCDRSTMTGSINSNGTGLVVNSATFTGVGGGACGGDITATITAQNLPWSGGSVVYAPDITRDGTVTIANFKVKAVLSIGPTCYYAGTLVANGYNWDNPNRPAPGVNEAQVGVNGATVNRASGSGILCPLTAKVTATYKLLGETTAGSGVFDETLYANDTP